MLICNKWGSQCYSGSAQAKLCAAAVCLALVLGQAVSSLVVYELQHKAVH